MILVVEAPEANPNRQIQHAVVVCFGNPEVYQGEGPGEQFLVGPAVATYTPCDASTPGHDNLGLSGT